MKKNKLYLSIYCSYMIIFLIFILLAVGTVVYYFHTLSENENNYEKNNFIYQYTTIEAKINSFAKISGLLWYNADIEDYVFSKDKGYYIKSYNVIRELDSYAEIMSETSEIYLIDIEDNTCFSRQGSMDVTDLMEKFDINKQAFRGLSHEIADGELGYVILDDNMMLVIDVHKYSKNKELMCMMACPFQNDFLMSQSNRRFCFVNAQNCESVGDARVLAAIKESGNKHSIQVVKSVNMRTYIYHSDYIDSLVYVQQYSTGSYIWKFVLWLGVAVTGILCFVGGKKLIDILSIKTYSPIDSVLQIFEGETDIDDLSSSVKKIIRENEMLNSKITVSRQKMKKYYLQEALKGVSWSENGEIIDEYNMELSLGKCRAIYFECSPKNEKLDEAYLFEQAFESLLINLLGGGFVRLERNKYVLIVPEEASEEKDLQGMLLKIIEANEKTYGVSIFAVVGKVVESVAEIDKSYKSALEMIEYRYSFDEQSVVCYDQFSFDKTELYYPLEIENELIDSVSVGNKERAKYLLDRLFDENIVSRSLSMQSITELKFALAATIKRIIRKMGETDERVFGEGSVVYLEISAAQTVRELRKNVTDLFSKLNEYVDRKNNNQQNRVIKKLTDYIYSNFDKDISLEMASEYMNISQGHINKIMRKELNKSFKEFLDEVRIDEAKKLLTETLMNINEVGEKTGYLNTNSFIRFFKKHTNVSPGEYRRKYSGITEE